MPNVVIFFFPWMPSLDNLLSFSSSSFGLQEPRECLVLVEQEVVTVGLVVEEAITEAEVVYIYYDKFGRKFFLSMCSCFL